MASNTMMEEEMEWETGGEGPTDEGAESSYNIDFTAEDAAVKGTRDLVLPSNVLSAIAGASPSASPGYGLWSSTNPNLDVNYARDAVIHGPESVDAGKESLIIEGLDQTPPKKYSMRTYSEELAWIIEQQFGLQHMQAMLDLPGHPRHFNDEDKKRMHADKKKDPVMDSLVSLQLAGVIPIILDVFKPRCTLYINYPSALELKNGDSVFLHQISDGHPSVAIMQHDGEEVSLRGNLYTVVMVDLDSGFEGGQYLHWVLANITDHSQNLSGVQGGNEEVEYEAPCKKPEKSRYRFLFVAYCQKQQFHLSQPISRTKFELRSFATAYGLETPVASLYVTAAAG